MRTTIEIDDALMAQAMAALRLATKRAVVEEGLRLIIRLHDQRRAFEDLRGIGWDGDLDAIREGR